jgi:glycosyltransferase involved in cell wall biosynthesis
MDRVNIILAAYNGEKYIGEQIESILKSTFLNWRLWIFDDGSTDKTGSIVSEYSKKWPDIRYNRNAENKGVTRNFLDGVRSVSNYLDKSSNVTDNEASKHEITNFQDYFMFCDQDDVWMPEKIEKTLKQMKKVENKYGKDSIAAVFTDARVVDENLKTITSSFFKTSKLDTRKKDLAHILMENKLIGCTVMINRKLTEKLGTLPSQARYHDWWIALIAASFGHISFLSEATMLYRQHSSNVVGNQSYSSYVKSRISSLHKQKEVLHKTILQAEEFYQIFHTVLPEKQKKQVYLFAHLEQKNCFEKRYLIVRNGFTKTGVLRNIGLLCLV